jgi:hypothetical protein
MMGRAQQSWMRWYIRRVKKFSQSCSNGAYPCNPLIACMLIDSHCLTASHLVPRHALVSRVPEHLPESVADVAHHVQDRVPQVRREHHEQPRTGVSVPLSVQVFRNVRERADDRRARLLLPFDGDGGLFDGLHGLFGSLGPPTRDRRRANHGLRGDLVPNVFVDGG